MYYPLMANIKGRNILIVGGGKVAYRKAFNFLEYGGQVTVLSPEIIEEFYYLKDLYGDNLIFINGKYNEKYLNNNIFLTVAATNLREVNHKVYMDCQRMNIWINVVDSKEESDFITPSTIKNDNLTIAISTMGTFPYLSKMIRKDMESKYKKFNKEYLKILEEIRYIILNNHKDRLNSMMEYALNLDIYQLQNFLEELKKENH